MARSLYAAISPVLDSYFRKFHGTSESGAPVPVEIAVSGGLDSQVLLDICGRYAAERPRAYSFRAVHIDHAIRSNADSLEDIRVVLSLCLRHDIPLMVYRSRPGDIEAAAKREGGTEAAARRLRYRIFEDSRRASGIIFTAHHQDDRRETLLMAMLGRQQSDRNASDFSRILDSQHKHIFRPFLDAGKIGTAKINLQNEEYTAATVDRGEIERWARAHAVPWHEDATNQDQSYLRNRIRHETLPNLQEQNPELARQLSRIETGNPSTAGKELVQSSGESQQPADQRLFGDAVRVIEFEGCNPDELYRQVLEYRNSLGRFSDYRISAKTLGQAIRRLTSNSQAATGSSEAAFWDGYDLRLIREGHRLFVTPLLAHTIKKGYFVALSAGSQRVITPFDGVHLLVRNEGPKDFSIVGSQNLRWGKKRFPSSTNDEYLGTHRYPEIPRWFQSCVPAVFDGTGIEAYIGPDLRTGQWVVYQPAHRRTRTDEVPVKIFYLE